MAAVAAVVRAVVAVAAAAAAAAVAVERLGRGRGRPQIDRGPMRNEDIVFDELRVVDENKEMIGVMSTDEALEMAAERDLDLVVLDPGRRSSAGAHHGLL